MNAKPRRAPVMSYGKEIFFSRPKRLKRSQTLLRIAASVSSVLVLKLIPSFSNNRLYPSRNDISSCFGIFYTKNVFSSLLEDFSLVSLFYYSNYSVFYF